MIKVRGKVNVTVLNKKSTDVRFVTDTDTFHTSFMAQFEDWVCSLTLCTHIKETYLMITHQELQPGSTILWKAWNQQHVTAEQSDLGVISAYKHTFDHTLFEYLNHFAVSTWKPWQSFSRSLCKHPLSARVISAGGILTQPAFRKVISSMSVGHSWTHQRCVSDGYPGEDPFYVSCCLFLIKY